MRTGRITLLSAFFLIACEKGSETPVAPAPVAAATVSAIQRAGDLLFARSNCVACHTADPAVIARVGELQSPKLDRIGARASAKWISNYLSTANHTGSTGMRMPNLLHGMGSDANAKTVRQLTAYLSSLPWMPEEIEERPSKVPRRHQCSCDCNAEEKLRACHLPDLWRGSSCRTN